MKMCDFDRNEFKPGTNLADRNYFFSPENKLNSSSPLNHNGLKLACFNW